METSGSAGPPLPCHEHLSGLVSPVPMSSTVAILVLEPLVTHSFL